MIKINDEPGRDFNITPVRARSVLHRNLSDGEISRVYHAHRYEVFLSMFESSAFGCLRSLFRCYRPRENTGFEVSSETSCTNFDANMMDSSGLVLFKETLDRTFLSEWM